MDQNQIPRIKRNIKRMIDGGAEETEIDEYLSIEGVSVDQLRTQPMQEAALRVPRVRSGVRQAPAKYGSGTKPDLGYLHGLTRQLTDGITLGWTDELISAPIHTVFDAGSAYLNDGEFDWSDSYKENLRNLNKERNDFSEENPIASGAAGTLGALMAGGPVANKVMGLGKETLKNAGTVKRTAANLAKYGTIGGSAGAVSGAGYADPGERLESAAATGAAGLGIGVIAPPLINTAGRSARAAYRTVADRFGRGPNTAAHRAIMRRLEDAGLSPEQAIQKLRQLGPNATIADLDDSLTRLARGAASSGGRASSQAVSGLKGRASEQSARVHTAIKGALDPQDFFAAEEQALTALKTNASDLYQMAYKEVHLDSPKLRSLLNRPIAKKVMKEASDLAAIEGRHVSRIDPELTAAAKRAVSVGKMGAKDVPRGGIGRGVTTEAIDDFKRGIDSMLDSKTYRNELTGKLNKKGRALVQYKNSILAEVDHLNPVYAQARKQYAGDAEVMKALKDGRDFTKLDPYHIQRKVADMSEAEVAAYRSGVAKSLQDLIDKAPDGADAVKRVFGNSMMRKRLSAVMGRRKFSELNKQMRAESVLRETEQKVLGGSPTSRIDADRSALGVDAGGPVADLIAGNYGRAISGTAGNAVRRLAAPPQKVSDELMPLLINADKPKNEALLRALSQRQKSAAITNRNKQAIAGALMYGTGGSVGR